MNLRKQKTKPWFSPVIFLFLDTKIYKYLQNATEPAKLLAAQETPQFHQEENPLVIHLL
jgi:hypothetical protein